MNATLGRTAQALNRLAPTAPNAQDSGMRDPSDATAATHFPTRAQGATRWRFAVRAPGPEMADSRDRAGAQKGMIILLVGGLAFWGAIAAAAVYLLR